MKMGFADGQLAAMEVQDNRVARPRCCASPSSGQPAPDAGLFRFTPPKAWTSRGRAGDAPVRFEDLFAVEPLAGRRCWRWPERLRPATLDDVVGQAHLLGEASRCGWRCRPGRLHSMIL